MAASIDQGHNRNAANFDKLIVSCMSYGEAYNPNKEALKIPAMLALLAEAQKVLSILNETTPAYKYAVSARMAAFKPLDKLITRANNALKASDTPKEVIESVQTIVRKLQGRRATIKKTEEEKKTAADTGVAIVEISTSQMSYDSRLDNLDKFIKMLSMLETYNPNEEDLKISSFSAIYADLNAKNHAVVATEATLNNARIARNEALYKEHVGMVDVALDAKTYIKSLFGATSPQYKKIGSLQFAKH